MRAKMRRVITVEKPHPMGPTDESAKRKLPDASETATEARDRFFRSIRSIRSTFRLWGSSLSARTGSNDER